MDKPHSHIQLVGQSRMTANGSGVIVVDINLGAYPESALAPTQRPTHGIYYLIQTCVWDRTGFDGDAAGWLFIQYRHVKISVNRLCQGSRDRCRAHDKHVRTEGLSSEAHAVSHAKAVLFVDDDQTQIAECDGLLEEGVGARNDVDAPVGQSHQYAFARRCLVSPRQRGDGVT